MEQLAERAVTVEEQPSPRKVVVIATSEVEAAGVSDLVRRRLATDDVIHVPDPVAAATEGADLVVLMGDPVPSDLRVLLDAPDRPSVVVVAEERSPAYTRRLLEAGAAAILRKDTWRRVLAPACLAVMSGHVCVPAESRNSLEPPALSLRERQVLALLASGLSTHEVAQRLYLAPSTVKSHTASAFRRLGVRSRREAVALILGSDEALRRIVLTSQPGQLPLTTHAER